MIKRTMGSALRARTYWSQAREISLRVLTHNIMILWRKQVFDRADLSPFLQLQLVFQLVTSFDREPKKNAPLLAFQPSQINGILRRRAQFLGL